MLVLSNDLSEGWLTTCQYGRVASGGALAPQPAARYRGRTRVSTIFFWVFPLFGHRTSPTSFLWDRTFNGRSQNEETSDLKNAGKSKGKKPSLKSRRDKIVYINPWELWSDLARSGSGAKAPPLAARPNAGNRQVMDGQSVISHILGGYATASSLDPANLLSLCFGCSSIAFSEEKMCLRKT